MVLVLGMTFRCYWIFIWFYNVDTASSICCYCSISRFNNGQFNPHNNPSARTMHSLKSTQAHSTLSHTDTYRLGASLCCSTTTSPVTSKHVRHLAWVRNSCYCIEVLLRTVIKHAWTFCVITRFWAIDIKCYYLLTLKLLMTLVPHLVYKKR